MGQVFDSLQGKQWREQQVRKITDKVFDRLTNQSGKVKLTFEDLYIAVLLLYNDINKRLPGPHFDPPSKEQVRAMIEFSDFNLDGEIDREEFVKFTQELTSNTLIAVSQGLILTLVVAPTVAMATKRLRRVSRELGRWCRGYPIQFMHPSSLLHLCCFNNHVSQSGHYPWLLFSSPRRRLLVDYTGHQQLPSLHQWATAPIILDIRQLLLINKLYTFKSSRYAN
ncbi:hypothetical protein SLA2020_448400 [Shorea laevis]